MWVICTRIWWVRPVSNFKRMWVWARNRRRTRKCVMASLPTADTAIFKRFRLWRPIGSSTVPPPVRTPCTTASYSRPILRSCNWATNDVCAGIVLATTINPVVSLSKRCTMPARGTPLSWGQWCNSAFNKVPPWWPAAGCTTKPAALLIIKICSSS